MTKRAGKSAKDDRVYLTHIQECLTRIGHYTQSGRDEFLSDMKTQDATLRNLQTLAEATQHLSDALKAAHPQIEWRAMTAFRNVVAHNYLGINLERVWDIVVNDLPPLEQHVAAMLAQEMPDAG